jgi:hypothetical protein
VRRLHPKTAEACAQETDVIEVIRLGLDSISERLEIHLLP